MHADETQNNVYEIKINEDDEMKTENMPQPAVSEKDEDSDKSKKTEINLSKILPSDQNYFDQLQRMNAEFANYKKRVENERLALSDFIRGEVVKSLLPVIDDFERLLQHVNVDAQEVVNGINLIYQKLLDTLKEQGLKAVKSIGEKFDPNIHEALLAENYEDSAEDIVIEEWRKGYVFKDRLLRPAQVKVNKIQSRDE